MPYDLDDFLAYLNTQLHAIEYDISLIRKQLDEGWFTLDKEKLIRHIGWVRDDAETLYSLIDQTHGPYLKREKKDAT